MVELTVACGRHHPMSALAEGRVQARGLQLHWLDLSPADIFWRMLRYEDFDAAELSFSSYLTAFASGQAKVIAIPVFPLRCFRHSAIYVRADAGIAAAQDLAGRRVGIPEYGMAVGLWVRGILSHEYGVTPAQIRWVTGGRTQKGRQERVALQLPPDVQVENYSDRTLDDCLERGEIDAMVSPTPPRAFRRGDGKVRRLFAPYQQLEMDYFRRTGVFPMMNAVVIRTAVLERYPWVVQNLLQAFSAARDEWYQTLQREADRLFGLPWIEESIQETWQVMGKDFWPYGIEPNRPTLETALQYAHEQGLTGRRLQVEEIFAASTAQSAAE